MSDIKDLELLIKSNVPIIVIESHEEVRVLGIIAKLGARQRMPVFRWTITEGIRELGRLSSHDAKRFNQPRS